jgi:hypothetical protein
MDDFEGKTYLALSVAVVGPVFKIKIKGSKEHIDIGSRRMNKDIEVIIFLTLHFPRKTLETVNLSVVGRHKKKVPVPVQLHHH